MILLSLAIRSIRPERDLRYDRAWHECMERIAERPIVDTLFIRREHGVLDQLEGIALKLTTTHLEFEYDGEVLAIPYAKIEGLCMANQPHRSVPSNNTRCADIQTETHSIRCKKLFVTEDSSPTLRIETPAGGQLRLAVTPLSIDRTNQFALTARDLATSHRRLPIESWQIVTTSASRWPLALPSSVYTVTGHGLDTQLTIQGPAEIELVIPKGYSRLHFELEISGIPVAPVTFYFKGEGAEYEVLYQQPRFPTQEQLADLQNTLTLPGPGTLRIHAPGDACFSTFLIGMD